MLFKLHWKEKWLRNRRLANITPNEVQVIFDPENVLYVYFHLIKYPCKQHTHTHKQTQNKINYKQIFKKRTDNKQKHITIEEKEQGKQRKRR